MGNRLVSKVSIRRGIALAVALAAATGFAVYSGAAGAAPQPSISQVQAKVNNLQAQVDKVGQQFDAAKQQLTQAKQRLAMVTKQANAAQASYDKARSQLAAVAVGSYENANQTSILGLITSGDPRAVLAQASLLTQLAGTHNLQTQKFLVAAQALQSAREDQQHTELGISQLYSQISQKNASINKLLNSQTTLLKNLTAQQQAAVTAATVGSTSGSTPTPTATPTTDVPASSQASVAVNFAYAQIGKPYVWGATGPDSYDCSGLVYAAWAAAGVSIPRTTYEQWAALPHVSLSALEPGDLILFNGEGHVAMYVGNGYIIDAPSAGQTVRKLPLSTSWYASSEDGAVRP